MLNKNDQAIKEFDRYFYELCKNRKPLSEISLLGIMQIKKNIYVYIKLKK